jgi:integrase
MPKIDATRREVSRTKATTSAYRARYARLLRSAGVESPDYDGLVRVVDWFATQHGRWAPATISQYRAALSQAIEDITPKLAMKTVEKLSGRLKPGPSPRRGGARRTSARKRKSLPRAEFVRLIRQLKSGSHPDDALAARLLSHNVLLFLRPVEWQTAIIQDGALVVKNAKATNGRSIGNERRRDLGDYGKAGVANLCDLLATLRARAKKAGSLWARLASRIARACKQIGIGRVSPYTTRHVGMANAKAWMSPAEVAASAGHKTTATSTSHYAKRRSGWGSDIKRVARPSVDDVEKVIRSPKSSRSENLAYLAEKKAEREAQAKKKAELEVQEEAPNPFARI